MPLLLTGLAKSVKARILFSSTSEVYGDPEVIYIHYTTTHYYQCELEMELHSVSELGV